MLLFSCRHSDYKQKILGDWKLVSLSVKDSNHIRVIQDSNIWHYEYKSGGYIFLEDNVCENKAGYINFKSEKPYLGTKTRYQIDGDSVSIFNPADGSWSGFRISSINKDTMYIRKNRWPNDPYVPIFKYVKQYSKPKNNFEFDEVIISNDGGWSPGHNILIRKNGDVIYHKYSSDSAAIYTSKISIKQFKEIENAFSKANVLNLKNDYADNSSDTPNSSITFVKNGKIIKTISDHDGSAPFELIWAYKPLEYLYQDLKLDLIENNESKPVFETFNFENANLSGGMEMSENFYLFSLIWNAKQANQSFVKKFDIISPYAYRASKIETDGRFYKVFWKKGGSTTYDIGFNFIDTDRKFVKFEVWNPQHK